MAVRDPVGRGEAARAAPLRAVRAEPRAVLLPPLGAGPAAGHGLRPGQAQRRGPARGAPRPAARRDRAAQVRPAGDRAAGQGAHPSLVDRARRRQRPARRARPREDHRGAAGGQGDREARARALEADGRQLPGRDRVVLQLPHDVPGPRRAGRLAAALRREPALRRRRRRHRRRPGEARRLRDVHRRGVAHGLLPQGAVLQARGLPRGHLPRRPARAPQRRRPLRNARGRRGARGVPRAARPHRPERLPLPLRAPDRGHLRPRAHDGAARRPGHPRDQGPRPRGRQRARGRRASSRPRAAR